MTPGVLMLQSAALAASLLHVLIDVWIGLFGRGGPMPLGQGALLIAFAMLYGWWISPLAAATAGVRGAMLALVMLSGVWAALGNGLVGLGACFIPCAGAAPFQDVAHVASLVLGVWAAWLALRAYRAMPGPTQWAPTVTAMVLMVVVFALEAANTVSP
jgi:hypothetical protein